METERDPKNPFSETDQSDLFQFPINSETKLTRRQKGFSKALPRLDLDRKLLIDLEEENECDLFTDTNVTIDFTTDTTANATANDTVVSPDTPGDVTPNGAHNSKNLIELLCSATWEGHVEEVVELLKKMKAGDINGRNVARGQTPLYCAARKGREDIIRLLLDVPGIDVNATDTNGNTPLHAASWQPHPGIISLLLSFRCDTTIKKKYPQPRTAREEASVGAYHVWKVFEEGGVKALLDNNYPIYTNGKDISISIRWFFKEANRWKPYDVAESDEIEFFWHSFKSGSFAPASQNGQYKTNNKYNFTKMIEQTKSGLLFSSIRELRRGTWFFQEDDGKWSPFTDIIANKLENGYLNDTLKDKLFITSSPVRYVQELPDGSYRQFRENSRSNSRAIKRGYSDTLPPTETRREEIPRTSSTTMTIESPKSTKLARSETENDFLGRSPFNYSSPTLSRFQNFSPAPLPFVRNMSVVARNPDRKYSWSPPPPVRGPSESISKSNPQEELVTRHDDFTFKPLELPELPLHTDKTTFRLQILIQNEQEYSGNIVVQTISINSTLEQVRVELAKAPHSLSPPLVSSETSIFKIPGSGIFLQENKELCEINYFLNCYLRGDDPKLMLVLKDSHYHIAVIHNTQQINNLLKPWGVPTYYKDPEDHIDEFRQEMSQIRLTERKKQTEKVPINLGYGPEIRPQANVVASLQLHRDQSKSVKILDTDTAESFLTSKWKYFEEFNTGKPMHSFVLKALGTDEYFVGNHRLYDFDYIRACVDKNVPIKFVLQPMEEIASDKFYLYQLEEEFLLNKKSLKYSHSELQKRERERELNGQDEYPFAKLTSVWDVHEYFRIKIIGVENIPKTTRFTSIYLIMNIYCGDEPICTQMVTPLIPLEDLKSFVSWETSFQTRIKVADLQRLTKLCFAVYSSKTTRTDQNTTLEGDHLGSVNWLIFDDKHVLQTGKVSVKLWNDPANPLAPCGPNSTAVDAMILTFEMEEYGGHSIVFPTEIMEDYVSFPSLRTPTDVDEKRLKEIVSLHSLVELTEADKFLIWRYRYYLQKDPKALPKFLRSVQKTDRFSIQEMYKLLRGWAPIQPIEALELLGASYADVQVRNFAVKELEGLHNADLEDFLLQLVQVLKFECYNQCALSSFLVSRAIRNKRVGHYFYWLLKSELHDRKISQRFALLLEAFLCGACATKRAIENQEFIQNQLSAIAIAIKPLDPAKALKLLHQELTNLNQSWPPNTELLIDPQYICKGIVVEKCKIMDSAKRPLWLVFQNGDPLGSDKIVIFKAGDDLRQDMLTLQMLRVMDKLWKKQSLDLKLNAYQCIVTGKDTGMIEVVTDSKTISKIQKEIEGSVTGAIKDSVLLDWLCTYNYTDKHLDKAIDNFSASCAGYCVATYVLGIGDRHNDNIMLKKDGHFFHIDFGHILGNFKKFMGISRERAPFVFTPDMAYVIMGGKKDKSSPRRTNISPRASNAKPINPPAPRPSYVQRENSGGGIISGMSASISSSSSGGSGGGGSGGSVSYNRFLENCALAHSILRENGDLFITLFSLMLSSGMPELEKKQDIMIVAETLSAANFLDILNQTGSQISTRFNFLVHNLYH